MGVPTGGSLGQAHGSITIDTTQAQQAPKVMAGVAANVERSTTKMATGLNAVSGAFNDLRDAMGLGFAINAIVQVGQAINEMVAEAAQLERLESSFAGLAEGVGDSSERMLRAMREASQGTISDADLILNANRALVTGVANSTSEMVQLIEVARARSVAMGISTQEAFERITQGIGKREKEVLDELGIVINLNQVYADYARSIGKVADELSETEKTQAFFNAVLEDSEELLKRNEGAADDATAALDRNRAAVDNLRAAFGDLFVEGQSNSASFWATMMEGLTGYLNAINQIRDEGLFDNAPTPEAGKTPWNTIGARPATITPGIDPKIEQAFEELGEAEAEIVRESWQERVELQAEYEARRSSVIADYNRTIARDAEDFARQQARSEAQYQQAVAEVHEAAAERERKAAEDLARDMARLQADNAKQQERWLRDLNESIAEAQADSAERLADRQADYDERLAEARGDSAERIQELTATHDERIQAARADSLDRLAEMEEDYQAERARAAADHGDTITDAAARLDARAVWEEQRRYAREQKEAEEAHAESVQEEQERLANVEAEQNKSNAKAIAAEQKRLAEFEAEQKKSHDKMIAQEEENLGERIEQEKEAHQERVDDAKEALDQRLKDLQAANAEQLREASAADAQRLSDMQTAHQNEQTEANTDYGIRLGRLQDDHEAQLGEMTAQHGLRLTQISTQAQDERKHLHDEFVKRMKQLGVSEHDLATEQYKHLNRELQAQQDHYDDLERAQINHQKRMLQILYEAGELSLEEYNNSLAILTGLLELIGGPGRHVDPRAAPIQTEPYITPTDFPLPQMAGASFVMPASGGGYAAGGTVSTSSFVIQPGAVQITASPGMSVSGLGDEFERRLLTVIRRIGGSRI